MPNGFSATGRWRSRAAKPSRCPASTRTRTARPATSIAARFVISPTTSTPRAVRRSRCFVESQTPRGGAGAWPTRFQSMSSAWRTSPSATNDITCAYCTTDTECDAPVEVNVPFHPPGSFRFDLAEPFAAMHARGDQPPQPPAAIAKQLTLGLTPQRDAIVLVERRVDAREIALVIHVVMDRHEQFRIAKKEIR